LISIEKSDITEELAALPFANSVCPTDDLTFSSVTKPCKLSVNPFGKGMVFCHININGIKSKFDEVKNLLSMHSVCVFSISASRLCDKDVHSLFHINGYTALRRDRNRESGGLLLYVNRHAKFHELKLPFKLPHELELIAIRVHYFGVKPIIVVTIYNPPHIPKNTFLEAFHSIVSHLNTFNLEMIIYGDFNIDLCKYDNHTFKLFLIKKEFNLRQMIFGPTRTGMSNRSEVTETCIDHIYVSHAEHFIKYNHFPFAGSDHRLTFVTGKAKMNVVYVRPGLT